MNCLKIYNDLVEKARNSTYDGYTEIHHIKPKCMGGDDSEDNLVVMSPEQHYTAHLLLAKQYPDNHSLWFASKMMTTGLNSRRNKLYGFVRRKCNTFHKMAIKNAWAIRRGYDSIEHQNRVIWNMYIHDKMTTKEISNKINLKVHVVCRSINDYAIDHDMIEELHCRRTELKSMNSRMSRINESSIVKKKRALAMNRSISHEVRSNSKKGIKNPSAVSITIDGIEYGTIADAILALNLPRHIINARLKSPKYKNWIRNEK